ncbi:MAG: chemotaxis protein CheW [Lachnospiraceae bacterium]|nr:chemotaxis protein CheW [Lachnospiraceae bacterium]
MDLNNNNAPAIIDEDHRGPIKTFQYIVIKVGDEQYGIDINFIDNIVRMTPITRIPKVSEYLKGVINLRGEVIPVMSLRLKMGLPADVITKASRIIILKSETEGNLGVIVDEVKEVVTLTEFEIEDVSPDVKDVRANFINGIGKRNNNELISLLDLSTITLEDNINA